jgi:hypothetical protein
MSGLNAAFVPFGEEFVPENGTVAIQNNCGKGA